MTDREKVKRMREALEVLAIAEAGAYPRAYQEQVQQLARDVLAAIADTSPQD